MLSVHESWWIIMQCFPRFHNMLCVNTHDATCRVLSTIHINVGTFMVNYVLSLWTIHNVGTFMVNYVLSLWTIHNVGTFMVNYVLSLWTIHNVGTFMVNYVLSLWTIHNVGTFMVNYVLSLWTIHNVGTFMVNYVLSLWTIHNVGKPVGHHVIFWKIQNILWEHICFTSCFRRNSCMHYVRTPIVHALCENAHRACIMWERPSCMHYVVFSEHFIIYVPQIVRNSVYINICNFTTPGIYMVCLLVGAFIG